MIDITNVKKRHNELMAKGIVNLSEQEQAELTELDVAIKRAEKDEEPFPINSVPNAIEALYWGIKDNDRAKTIRAYDALCRLLRVNTGGARRIKEAE